MNIYSQELILNPMQLNVSIRAVKKISTILYQGL